MEGWTIFLFLMALGLLVIFGAIDNAMRSRDNEQQHRKLTPS